MLRGLYRHRHDGERSNHVSLEELGRVIGVSGSVMSRIEREIIGLKYRDAQKLAKRLGTTMEGLS